jgi:hypothetical protein
MAETITLERFRSATTGVAVGHPQGWHITDRPLPDYGYPEQVFGASNIPISVPASRHDVWDPDANEENYPRVTNLPASAVFVWMYRFTKPDGPTKYGRYAPPLRYTDAEQITETGDARWPNLIQRELGFENGRFRFTIWVWEGQAVSARTRAELEELIASIEV